MVPFILSIEPDAGTYQRDFPPGTAENAARLIAEDTLRKKDLASRLAPERATRIVTVAVMQKGKIVDVFDGIN